MSLTPLPIEQRGLFRMVGLVYPLSFIAVLLANLALIGPLLVRGDALESAKNILAHESTFRLGILLNLLYCAASIVVLAAFYEILKRVHHTVALVATLFRLVHVVSWMIVAVELFAALRFITYGGHAQALSGEQLFDIARIHLSGSDVYYVGLLFWSLGATLGSVLWLRTGYIPRALALAGIVGSVWCVLCTAVYYVWPGFADAVNLWWFDSPMVVFELVLSGWLLAKSRSAQVATSA